MCLESEIQIPDEVRIETGIGYVGRNVNADNLLVGLMYHYHPPYKLGKWYHEKDSRNWPVSKFIETKLEIPKYPRGFHIWTNYDAAVSFSEIEPNARSEHIVIAMVTWKNIVATGKQESGIGKDKVLVVQSIRHDWVMASNRSEDLSSIGKGIHVPERSHISVRAR